MITNPLLAGVHARRLQTARGVLPRLPTPASELTVLSLADYVDRSPEKFHNPDACAEFLAWLSDARRQSSLRSELASQTARIDRGLRTLSEINRQEWHDDIRPPDADELRLLDRVVHPAYLRLVEGVLHPLLLLAARINRLERSKSADGLDIFNVIEEVKQVLPQSCKQYDHVVRNGIAHGGVEFIDDDVHYVDRNSTRVVRRRTVVPLVDDVLDTCNGLALALKHFLASSGWPTTEWPREVLLQELQALVSAPWWEVEACLQAQSIPGKQLNIYVRVDTRDVRKAQYSMLQTAACAAALAPGFYRYWIFIRAVNGLPGWAGFDGAKLATVAASQTADLSDYAKAVEEGLLFYVPDFKLRGPLATLDTFRVSASLNAPAALDKFWRDHGLCPVVVRNVESHTDPWRVINAVAVVPGASVDAIRRNVRGILRQVGRAAARSRPAVAMVPEGFMRVHLYDRDLRRRRLLAYGLGPALVATLTRTRDSRKNIIDIMGSRVETVHGVRVAWNRNWPGLGSHLDSPG